MPDDPDPELAFYAADRRRKKIVYALFLTFLDQHRDDLAALTWVDSNFRDLLAFVERVRRP